MLGGLVHWPGALALRTALVATSQGDLGLLGAGLMPEVTPAPIRLRDSAALAWTALAQERRSGVEDALPSGALPTGRSAQSGGALSQGALPVRCPDALSERQSAYFQPQVTRL